MPSTSQFNKIRHDTIQQNTIYKKETINTSLILHAEKVAVFRLFAADKHTMYRAKKRE